MDKRLNPKIIKNNLGVAAHLEGSAFANAWRAAELSDVTLRDLFAGMAMIGMMKQYAMATGVGENIRDSMALDCQKAYLMADLLLKERESNES